LKEEIVTNMYALFEQHSQYRE